MNAGRVKPSSVNAYKRGEALPVTGTALALAEDTAGVEPAGEAEKATAANFEALISLARDKAVHGREVQTPPREGKRTHELIHRCESRHVKTSCPLGRDQALGTQEGGC